MGTGQKVKQCMREDNFFGSTMKKHLSFSSLRKVIIISETLDFPKRNNLGVQRIEVN